MRTAAQYLSGEQGYGFRGPKRKKASQNNTYNAGFFKNLNYKSKVSDKSGKNCTEKIYEKKLNNFKGT